MDAGRWVSGQGLAGAILEALQDDAANDVRCAIEKFPEEERKEFIEALMGNENRELYFYGFAFLCKGRLALGNKILFHFYTFRNKLVLCSKNYKTAI